jgi:hypothetical protein
VTAPNPVKECLSNQDSAELNTILVLIDNSYVSQSRISHRPLPQPRARIHSNASTLDANKSQEEELVEVGLVYCRSDLLEARIWNEDDLSTTQVESENEGVEKDIDVSQDTHEHSTKASIATRSKSSTTLPLFCNYAGLDGPGSGNTTDKKSSNEDVCQRFISLLRFWAGSVRPARTGNQVAKQISSVRQLDIVLEKHTDILGLKFKLRSYWKDGFLIKIGLGDGCCPMQILSPDRAGGKTGLHPHLSNCGTDIFVDLPRASGSRLTDTGKATAWTAQTPSKEYFEAVIEAIIEDSALPSWICCWENYIPAISDTFGSQKIFEGIGLGIPNAAPSILRKGSSTLNPFSNYLDCARPSDYVIKNGQSHQHFRLLYIFRQKCQQLFRQEALTACSKARPFFVELDGTSASERGNSSTRESSLPTRSQIPGNEDVDCDHNKSAKGKKGGEQGGKKGVRLPPPRRKPRIPNPKAKTDEKRYRCPICAAGEDGILGGCWYVKTKTVQYLRDVS